MLMLFGFFAALATVAFVGIHVYTYGALWLNSIRLRWRLASQGRVLTVDEAKEKLRQQQGMLLVDAPTIGWNVVRIWWSPITDFTPRPAEWSKELLCPHEDFVNYDKFIEESSGIAKLVDGFVISQRLQDFLAQHFETREAAFVASGCVLTQRAIEKKRLERSKQG